MNISRSAINKIFKNIAKTEYEQIKEKKIKEIVKEKDHFLGKQDVLEESFTFYTKGTHLGIEVHRGLLIFIRRFIELNVDTGFDFNMEYSKSKNTLSIRIPKSSIDDSTFEKLVEIMYIHTLI